MPNSSKASVLFLLVLGRQTFELGREPHFDAFRFHYEPRPGDAPSQAAELPDRMCGQVSPEDTVSRRHVYRPSAPGGSAAEWYSETELSRAYRCSPILATDR